MNNKVKRVLVLLFVVSTLLLMIGSVNANADNLNENLEASYTLNDDVSVDGNNMVPVKDADVSNQLTMSNSDETINGSSQGSLGESNSNVVSDHEDATIDMADSDDKLSDAYFTFEQTTKTPYVLIGDEVIFDYLVKYQGPGRLNSEYIIVDVHFSQNEMTYLDFIPNQNQEAPWLGQEWWGRQCYTIDVQGDTIYVKYKPPVAFEEGYLFNFSLKFKTKINGTMGTGAHIDNTYQWAINTTDALEKLNLTKFASKSQINYGDDIYFDVCLENNKLRSYFGDYRRILLIQDYFPDGLTYVDYKINPDKNGILPDESKIKVRLMESGLVEIEYDTRDGWLPNSFLNVTLHFKGTKYGIQCNHIRTWWEDGTEYWAQASVCVGEPGLNLTKKARSKQVAVGDDVYFDIYCENNGTIPYYDHFKYPGWLLIDELYPDGLEYIDFEVNPDKNGFAPKDNVTIDKLSDRLRIAYNIGGSWAPGESLNVTVHFKAIKEGPLQNNVTVYWKWKDWGDPEDQEVIGAGDNDTVAVGQPDFAIEKISNYENVEIGDMVVFTIIYSNTGYCNLTGVYIIDNKYSEGLEYYDFSDKSLWRFDGVDTWYYKDILQPGESAVLELTFKTTSVGFKENTAVAGNNVTNYTLNSTDNVTVLDKDGGNDDVEDAPEPEIEPADPVDNPNEDPTGGIDKNGKPDNPKADDSKAAGNPLFLLVLCLLTLCSVPLRGKK